jgi:hypothetical protein
MNKLLLTLFLLAFSVAASSQVKVEKINLNGKDYTVTKDIPTEYQNILGRYKYEWGKTKEEPIVELNKDNTGLFQPHDVPAIPIKFWLDCDENGVIRKQEGVNGRYQLTLLIQYGPGSRIYPEGTYGLMGVAVVVDKNYAVIYGERYKSL